MEVLKGGCPPFCPTFVQPKFHFSNYKMTFLGMLDKTQFLFCPTFCPSVGQNTPPYRGEVCFVQLSNVQWREEEEVRYNLPSCPRQGRGYSTLFMVD